MPPEKTDNIKDIPSNTTSTRGDNVRNEAYDAMKTSSAGRPQAPHYIGQDVFDTAAGMADLYGLKRNDPAAAKLFGTAETDLQKESKLISSANTDENLALTAIRQGNTGKASTDLNDAIKGMHDNLFVSTDRHDLVDAMKALKSGDGEQAETDIKKSEEGLHTKGVDVATARSDMSNAETAAKGGAGNTALSYAYASEGALGLPVPKGIAGVPGRTA
jgi:hypothetical protein